jgi:cobyrinic acid a,c-diamide synthase
MGQKLHLGYRRAVARRESCCLDPQQIVWGHEFHRSYLSPNPDLCLYLLQGLPLDKTVPLGEGWSEKNLHASYLHLHFGGFPTVPQKFLRHCLDFSDGLD